MYCNCFHLYNNVHLPMSRYTPLDLAIFYDQTACIELLKSSGALSQDDIKDFAATCIQSVYKGYRYVRMCVCVSGLYVVCVV